MTASNPLPHHASGITPHVSRFTLLPPRSTFPFLLALSLLLSLLLVAGCGGNQSNDGLPTLVPTANVNAASALEATAVLTATPTASPLPLTATLSGPDESLPFDLGQTINLAVTASDLSGIASINLTANGQNIGTHNGRGELTLTITQTWTPQSDGIQRIIVTVGSRTGAVVTSNVLTYRVIDRELLARYAPIWAEIEGNVTELRGLPLIEPVEPILLSEVELRQRLSAGFYYTEADAYRDVLVLNAFDFVPRQYDLYDASYRYLGQSIAGFYDPLTKEFVVVSNDAEINALEEWTHSHELMHALQDQHFQLGLLTEGSFGYENSMALRALAEGEAELVQEQYVAQGYFSDADLIEIFNLLQRIRNPNATDVPPVLVNAFLFAYIEGKEFAQTIYNRGGWAGLNAAWQNLPQSTEHIIHPDRYFAGDAPQIVSLAPLTPTLGAGWVNIQDGVFGEFYLREYLYQKLDEADVNTAATGWGGDHFVVYWHEESDGVVMALRHAWDSFGDANEFAAAYGRYANAAYGTQSQSQPDGSLCWQAITTVCFYQNGAETLIVRAPDLTTASAVLAATRP
jgi:hypothetical protein